MKTISWLRGLRPTDEVVSIEINKLREEQRRNDELPKVTLLSVGKDNMQSTLKFVHLGVWCKKSLLSGIFGVKKKLQGPI